MAKKIVTGLTAKQWDKKFFTDYLTIPKDKKKPQKEKRVRVTFTLSASEFSWAHAAARLEGCKKLETLIKRFLSSTRPTTLQRMGSDALRNRTKADTEKLIIAKALNGKVKQSSS